MNIRTRNSLAALCCLMLAAAPSALRAQSLTEKLNAALKRVFGESAQASTGSATLNDEQVARIRASSGFVYGRTVNYYMITVGGKRAGYAMVDEVKGKAKLITYVVIVDANIIVKDLEVLAYREPYGGEIAYDGFRKQFRGKGTRDPLKVGVDIRNVSGATISTNAVTGGTRKLMAVLRELKEAGALR
jgi:Na+-translocating ferredoxin:NAD+ oxidoreductase RnfG subunit